jgi:peptidyl-prolyl cis-trans isomerase C
MRRCMLIVAVLVLGLAGAGASRGLVAEGGGYMLTPDDLRFEVLKLGPSYGFSGTRDERLALVDLLSARFFLAESALAWGYGGDELQAASRMAEAAAVGESYRKWKVEKSIRVPRAESRQVLDRLDRKMCLKQMVFRAYPVAEEASARLRAGESFESVEARFSGRDDVEIQDLGWKVWREFDRTVATQIYNLSPGQATGILREKPGYSIYYLVEDAPWGEPEQELIILRSKRFIRWLDEADLQQREREELSRIFKVRYDEQGLAAALQAFDIAFQGGMPPEDLFSPPLVTFEVRVGTLVYPAGYFFNYYWSLPPLSQPYVGDLHAIQELALDAILIELEAAAGYRLGLDREREVVWSVKKAREELLIPKMEEYFRSGVTVSPEEIAGFYDSHRSELVTNASYRARRILVDSDEKAQEVMSELRSGADFAQVAQRVSLDRNTGERGGDLGTVGVGMFQAYDSVAAGLEVGKYSTPFVTSDGYEILKLEERSDSRVLSFDESRDYIEQRVRELKANGALVGWVNGAKRVNSFTVDQDLLFAVQLPEPEWRSGVARDSSAEGEAGTGGGTELEGSRPGQETGESRSPAAGKQRPARRKMIKKQG